MGVQHAYLAEVERYEERRNHRGFILSTALKLGMRIAVVSWKLAWVWSQLCTAQ